ncbi:uncharacterized protein [Choristoneura fumiferana]|uniref:uncharacterized protein n=1 Tax=Choristoneura fumiferana TaxID=7141 RepID=UPI003D15527C
MSIPLLLYLLSTEFLLFLDLIHCAPKIGGIMFEPILFEAFESDEKTTGTAITGRSKQTITQLDTHISDVDMEYLDEETVITSTSTSTTTAEETTAFISELNIETESTPKNATLAFNHNTTTDTTPTTKKVMLYELLTVDKLKLYGRAREESTTENVILNFMGYNFDDTICRIVDDRVLCGYNSNPQPAQPVQAVEVGNGCRLRGDRIECGYVNPPFDGMRRPVVRPEGNRNLQEKLSDKQLSESSEEIPELTPSYSTTEPTTTTTKLTTTTTKLTSKVTPTFKVITTSKAISTNPSTTTSPSTTTVTTTTTERTTVKIREHCVEKDDRIVCYDVRK